MDVHMREGWQNPTERSAYRLLVIEDDHNTAEGLRVLFEFDGFSVSVAEDAVDGLRLARLQHPHVIVCDISLPGVLTGFDVAAVLRSDPATSSTFLVAVTACGEKTDRLRAADVGFQAYLSKPVSYPHLLEVVLAGVEQTARG